jgi:hypothetical protein
VTVKEKKEDRKHAEQKKVEEWRRYIFRDVMEKTGATEIMADDIEALVRSDATWEQVQSLREKDCSPELIIKILT